MVDGVMVGVTGGVFGEVVTGLLPTVGVTLLFGAAIWAIVRADAAERAGRAQVEAAEDAADRAGDRAVPQAADEPDDRAADTAHGTADEAPPSE